MTPLDLNRDPLGAAIRARPAAPPALPVWVHIAASNPSRWCVLRSASPGGLIRTLCLGELPADPVCVSTQRPHNSCPACETELAAGTLGAATAVEPSVAPSRAPTLDLRGPRAAASAASDDWRLDAGTGERLEEP